MLKKILGILVIIFGLLALGWSSAASASVPPAVGLKWTSTHPGFNSYTYRPPLTDEKGNAIMIYGKPVSSEDYPKMNSYIVLNAKGTVLTKKQDFTNTNDIKDIKVLKDGLIISQGTTLKKVDFKGKTRWSRVLDVVYGHVWDTANGNVIVYANKTVYKIRLIDGKTMGTYQAPMGLGVDPKSETVFIYEQGFINAYKGSKKVWRIASPAGYKYTWITDISPNGTIAVRNVKETFPYEELLQVYSSSGKLKYQKVFKAGIGINDARFNGKDYILVEDNATPTLHYWLSPSGTVVGSFTNTNHLTVFQVTNNLNVYGSYNKGNPDVDPEKSQFYYQKLSKTGVVVAETQTLSPYGYFTTDHGLIDLNVDYGKKTLTLKGYKVMEAPATPSNGKAVSTGYDKVKVLWSAVVDADGYEVYRSTAKNGSYGKIASISSGGTTSYLNSGLTTGRTYYYKIRALSKIGGTTLYSPFTSIVSSKPVLATPTDFKAKRASKTSIKLSWSKSSEASGYALYQATSENGTYTNIKTITSGNTVSYTNKGLKKGKTYYYKIRAYHDVKKTKVFSSYSGTVSAKPY